MSEDSKTTKNSLDKSIDLGMDQFGRFVKLRWLMLVIVSIVIWYFFFYIAPQLSAPSPGSILYYAFQISFALLFGIMQFVCHLLVSGTSAPLLGDAWRDGCDV